LTEYIFIQQSLLAFDLASLFNFYTQSSNMKLLNSS